MSSVPDPHTFYAEQIPAQFNRALDEQAAKGEEGQRVYDLTYRVHFLRTRAS